MHAYLPSVQTSFCPPKCRAYCFKPVEGQCYLPVMPVVHASQFCLRRHMATKPPLPSRYSFTPFKSIYLHDTSFNSCSDGHEQICKCITSPSIEPIFLVETLDTDFFRTVAGQRNRSNIPFVACQPVERSSIPLVRLPTATIATYDAICSRILLAVRNLYPATAVHGKACNT